VSTSLDQRLTALDEAAGLAEGRLEPEQVQAARAVVERAGQRLGLGVEATVVALAGPTGAGKSSLFNAIAGSELTAAGARRPTTSTTTAAIWGEGGGPLLDWLGVPRRHRLDGGGELDGLVLLDLPDFDSVERSHRDEADRVLELADLAVWVADPQKYADASLHDRYLKPLASHHGAMLVLLNQADRLQADALAAQRADLVRLLAQDGLDGVEVLPVSARTGQGLEELRDVLARRVTAREAAVARLAADVGRVTEPLARACGEGRAAGVGRSERAGLLAALQDAAGAPIVVRAVAASHQRQGSLAAGWPVVRWGRRLRPDPLRRLHLSGGEDTTKALERSSLPRPAPAKQAQVSAATRTLAARAAEGLEPPWPSLVRSAANRSEERLPDALDQAVAGAELSPSRPRWWAAANLLQKVLALAAAVGALWLLALAALGYLQLGDVVPTPDVEGFALPTVLLLGGLLVGLLLSALFRWFNAIGARRRARRAAKALRRRIEAVADEQILLPVGEELAARERLCGALAKARS